MCLGTTKTRFIVFKIVYFLYYNCCLFTTLLGEVTSHIQYFKSCRNKWVEHFVMETNKTVVRLEKLLINLPIEPNKRKSMSINHISR